MDSDSQSKCEICGEVAAYHWMILHLPGCPMGEPVEDDDVEEDEEYEEDV